MVPLFGEVPTPAKYFPLFTAKIYPVSLHVYLKQQCHKRQHPTASTFPPSQSAPERLWLSVPPWEGAEMASIYKHRNGWQACAKVLGERIKRISQPKVPQKDGSRDRS